MAGREETHVMTRKIWMLALVIGIHLLLSACGEPDMEGIILEVTEDKILLSENLSPEKYEEIKDKSLSDIQEDEEGIPLIFLTYDDPDEWSKGDRVHVWLDGDILLSYPRTSES